MHKPLISRILHPLVISLAATVAVGQTGSIEGRVIGDLTGKGLRRLPIRAYAHGRGVALVESTEQDGSFVIRDVPAGRYAVCFPAGDSWRPAIAPEIEVREGESSSVTLRCGQSLMIEGDSWVQSYPSFSQSLTATGLAITSVGVKAFGSSKPVEIAMCGSDARRVTEPVGGESTKVCRWSGGELPTLPGQAYRLDLQAANGESWVPAVAGRGDVYPGGQAIFNGTPRPHSDLGLVICEDNDGLRTDYAVQAGWRSVKGRGIGQTFVAFSQRITFASASLIGTTSVPVYVRFSIHEDGPGGRQIGPSKGVEVGANAAVAWGPDEVPVVPGKTYYLHIESFSGATLLALYQPDAYESGRLVLDGQTNADRDLAAIVAGQISEDDFLRLVKHPQQEEVIPLVNASFEEGDTGWHSINGETAASVGCTGGIVPAWGNRMHGWTNIKEGENLRPTVYQHVKVKKGERYCFSASACTDHQGGRSSDVKLRLVVSPTGGIDLRNYDVVTSSQWYATEGQWRRGSVEFVAKADEITVGYEFEQRFKLDRSSLYVDGALLERIASE